MYVKGCFILDFLSLLFIVDTTTHGNYYVMILKEKVSIILHLEII